MKIALVIYEGDEINIVSINLERNEKKGGPERERKREKASSNKREKCSLLGIE